VSSKRIIITLPAEDKQWLEGYSRAQKISLAESIRKGVQKLKKADGLKTYERLVENTYGLWKKGDGLAYQMKIRSETSNSAREIQKTLTPGNTPS